MGAAASWPPSSVKPWSKQRSNSGQTLQPLPPLRLFTHDEGACWAPAEVYSNSIILTHYAPAPRAGAGGVSAPPLSATTRREYNYSAAAEAAAAEGPEPRLPSGSWGAMVGGHGCFDPAKDIAISAFRWVQRLGVLHLLPCGIPAAVSGSASADRIHPLAAEASSRSLGRSSPIDHRSQTRPCCHCTSLPGRLRSTTPRWRWAACTASATFCCC